jgi:hypothetical protein
MQFGREEFKKGRKRGEKSFVEKILYEPTQKPRDILFEVFTTATSCELEYTFL